MFAAGPTVQLVDPDQPAADAVRHFALLAYMLREIRRGLIGYLSEIRCHHNHHYVHSSYFLDLFVLLLLTLKRSKGERKTKSRAVRMRPVVCFLVTVGNGLNT